MVLLLAAVILTPAASAKPGYVVIPGHRERSLSLKGTNGYVISVSADDRFITLSAAREDGYALYLVKAHGSPDDRINATFPGLGRVAVEFHPSQKPQHKPPFFPHCRGGGETIQRGVFTGTIKFRGERGFTEADAARARGSLESSSKEICPRDDHDPTTDVAVGGDPVPGYSLVAGRKSAGREIVFSAFRETPDDPAFPEEVWFDAILRERRSGMYVFKQVSADGPAASFVLGGDPNRPSSATVEPSSPFRGTAAFEGGGGASTWEGALEVDFPGVPGLQLTGPSFGSRLCLDKRCVGASRGRGAR